MRTASAISLGILFLAASGQAQDGKIDVRLVSYDGLKDLVVKNRGKVVVVDFWSTTCVPCIRNFPHMIEMQHKYAKEGLATISVSFDKLDEFTKTEDQRKERVLGRLAKLKSDLVNVILDESWDFAKDKLRITAIPSVYVFSRQGKWVQFGGKEGDVVEPAAVEKLVVQLLQEK